MKRICSIVCAMFFISLGADQQGPAQPIQNINPNNNTSEQEQSAQPPISREEIEKVLDTPDFKQLSQMMGIPIDKMSPEEKKALVDETLSFGQQMEQLPPQEQEKVMQDIFSQITQQPPQEKAEEKTVTQEPTVEKEQEKAPEKEKVSTHKVATGKKLVSKLASQLEKVELKFNSLLQASPDTTLEQEWGRVKIELPWMLSALHHIANSESVLEHLASNEFNVLSEQISSLYKQLKPLNKKFKTPDTAGLRTVTGLDASRATVLNKQEKEESRHAATAIIKLLSGQQSAIVFGIKGMLERYDKQMLAELEKEAKKKKEERRTGSESRSHDTGYTGRDYAGDKSYRDNYGRDYGSAPYGGSYSPDYYGSEYAPYSSGGYDDYAKDADRSGARTRSGGQEESAGTGSSEKSGDATAGKQKEDGKSEEKDAKGSASAAVKELGKKAEKLLKEHEETIKKMRAVEKLTDDEVKKSVANKDFKQEMHNFENGVKDLNVELESLGSEIQKAITGKATKNPESAEIEKKKKELHQLWEKQEGLKKTAQLAAEIAKNPLPIKDALAGFKTKYEEITSKVKPVAQKTEEVIKAAKKLDAEIEKEKVVAEIAKSTRTAKTAETCEKIFIALEKLDRELKEIASDETEAGKEAVKKVLEEKNIAAFKKAVEPAPTAAGAAPAAPGIYDTEKKKLDELFKNLELLAK